MKSFPPTREREREKRERERERSVEDLLLPLEIDFRPFLSFFLYSETT